MFFRRNGSITVFLCIVLAALIPLCGVLIDLVRYNEAKKMAESSLKICAESMLAAYDTQLREQFGLFAMYPRENIASMEKEIYELLSDNLTPENSDGKATDLFGFRVNRVVVIPIYNYSEPYVLEQQITEFMKYRAPIQMVGEFLEKLKTMSGLMKEGDMVEKNMKIDKLLNSLREKTVCLSLLMKEKMPLINKYDWRTYWQNCNKDMGEFLQNIKNNEPSADKIKDVNDRMERYRKAKSECDAAGAAYNQAVSSFTPLDERIKSLEGRIAALQAESHAGKGNEDGSENGSQGETSGTDAEIQSLQKEIEALRPEWERLKADKDRTYSNFMSRIEDLNAAMSALNSALDAVLKSYNDMYAYGISIAQLLTDMTTHLDLHDRYCRKAIELVDAIIPQAQELQSEKASLKKDIAENPDSAVSGQIGADIDKKLLSVDVDALTAIKSRLEANAGKLGAWLQAVQKAQQDVSNRVGGLKSQIDALNKMKENPGEGSAQIAAYTVFSEVTGYRNTLVNSLMDFTAYPEMKSSGTYVIPEYETAPPPTDDEKKGFAAWFVSTFGGEPLTPEEKKDEGGLDKARESIGGTTKEIAEFEEEKEEGSEYGSINVLNKIGCVLPSYGGSISSEGNLNRIAKEVYNTKYEQGVNPFDEDPQGYSDKIDEKEKNFFDYELERIKKLLDIITNLLKNAGESLMKSLYMNEYIVSAFKNYTTKNNAIEHDIGWDRPLDTTLFSKAEVEYVLFGRTSELDNIAASRRSVFAIRLIFNLLHVYTCPEKLAGTLKIASAIAGWTIFGVPIVHNLLLVGWAALESWIDTAKLMNGEQIALLKTTQSWFLDLETLKAYLLGQLKVEVTNYLSKKAEDVIEKGAAYIEETVGSFIDSQVDLAFSGIENGWQTVITDISTEAQNAVDGFALQVFPDTQSDTLDGFLDMIKGYISGQVSAFCEKIKGAGAEFIEGCKAAIKKKLHGMIFESNTYKKLKEKVTDFAKDTINKGVSAAVDKAGSLLGASDGRSGGANNVLGRLIMMDYTDYLRLMLLAVPPETKALRVSDLMQLNINKTTPESNRIMSQYYTALYVKAYIDMDTWIIPESLFKRNSEGMITIEWSLGY
jgi:uncharacterized protein YukE